MERTDRTRIWPVFLPILIALCVTFLFLSILATRPAQADRVDCLKSTTTLEDLVECIHGYMPGNSDGFVKPDPTEIAQWREVVGHMMDGDCDDDTQCQEG